RLDQGATKSLLQTIRQASPEAASAEAMKLLNQGVAPSALWDAVLLSASELMMRSPGIVAIHATTAANSLHYIFGASGDDMTRRLALLQAVGWQPLYRDRNKATNVVEIDVLGGDGPVASGDEAVGEIFESINENRGRAAAKAVTYLQRGGSAE